MNITKDKLIKLLDQAFDEGLCGFQDLKESVIEKLAEDFIEKNIVAIKNDGYFPNAPLCNIPPPTDMNQYRDVSITWDSGQPMITGTWYPTAMPSPSSISNISIDGPYFAATSGYSTFNIENSQIFTTTMPDITPPPPVERADPIFELNPERNFDLERSL